MVNIEKLGRKRLAYEIADLREGNYVAMQFRSTGAASKELERQLKLHEDVLRALVIRLDKKALAAMAHALANPRRRRCDRPRAADAADAVPLTPPMQPADRPQVAPTESKTLPHSTGGLVPGTWHGPALFFEVCIGRDRAVSTAT